MNASPARRVALLYPGDREARDRADPSQSRFAAVFKALADAGVAAEPAVYHDEYADEVEAQLRRVDLVQVWCNPIQDGHRRDRLDAILRRVAELGVHVSAHPDAILKLGTKNVLVEARDLPFGSDVHRVGSVEQLATDLPERLKAGPRVLKQHRGHSGIGVWRIEWVGGDRHLLRHAQRGALESTVGFAGVVSSLAPHFDDGGYMIDQAWLPSMVEGMTRAYLVRDRVAGFGHQAVIALHPLDAAGHPVPTTPRLYSDADDARFQGLKQRLEGEWLEMLCKRLSLAPCELPLLWDADFFHVPVNQGAGGFVLCEINVSSVAPFPDSTVQPLVFAIQDALKQRASIERRPE